MVDNSGDNERPAGDELVPSARDKLVRGKPLVRRRLVIKPDTVHGDAEARIDVIDDGAPFGSDNINGIAQLELSIHRSAYILRVGGPLPRPVPVLLDQTDQTAVCSRVFPGF